MLTRIGILIVVAGFALLHPAHQGLSRAERESRRANAAREARRMFAVAGVGKVVAGLAERWIPLKSPLIAVVTYTVGMAVFTVIMGNAFAAFPVMTAGIGLPLIMTRFGGNVTVMAAVGMLSGFCGTLMTPMAANFNIVSTALLELPDEDAVVKAQIPTAVLLLAFNTLVLYTFVYRH